ISTSADECEITTPGLSSPSDANAKIETTPRDQIPSTPPRKRELRMCFNCEQQGHVQSACTAPQASPMTLYNRRVKYAKEHRQRMDSRSSNSNRSRENSQSSVNSSGSWTPRSGGSALRSSAYEQSSDDEITSHSSYVPSTAEE